MRLSRRGILIGSLAGGGLIAGYLLRPRSFPLPLAPAAGEVAFDAWIRIAREGVITVAVPQLEMGQGVTTLLPQIAAVELGADWRQIAVEPAPASAHYANLPLAARWAELWMPALPSLADTADSRIVRRWAQDNRFAVTADGTALEAFELPLREAAATVRALLAMAAAVRWDVPPEECEAEAGFIIHGDKRESFAVLAQEAAGFDPPETPPLRPQPASEDPKANPAGGALAFPRLDLPSKADGSHVFAGDVRLPDMVYAAIRHGPVGNARLTRFDSKAARGVQGMVSIVRSRNWLAAVATNWWAAEQALGRMKPVFEVSDLAESTAIAKALDDALRTGEATRLHETGEPDRLLESDFDLVRRYDVAPAFHATPETASATARLIDGRLELWLATQAPEAARSAAARAIGIDRAKVVLYPMAAGGSFDRRLDQEHAAEAAIIARAAGRPVQLVWSRWQEQLAGHPRSPVAALVGARLGSQGGLVGLRTRLALPDTGQEFGRRLFGGQSARDAERACGQTADALAAEGAVPPYAIEHLAVEHVPVRVGLPTGRMRGNAHGYTAFFTESFLDELAHDLRREPLGFRMAMLGHDARLAECLQRVASLAGWDGGAMDSGQGLACHVIGDGRIAVIASAERGDMGVRVDRISAIADIGRIVNVDIARQQIEGGLIFGLGLALGASTEYTGGLPFAGRLRNLNLPLLADCPRVEVDFIENDRPPADPGELGVAAVAPAIANALFSATGLRFRRLPLLSEGL